MRAQFIVQYEVNRPINNMVFQLKPSDYHRVPDHSYPIEYDNNHVVIDRKVTGDATQPVYNSGLSVSKQIIHRYLTDQFAGGRFVIYADHMAEWTTYGSGVPILNSMIGTIVDVTNTKN
jgi:hypothetical protein